ncbi:FecR family protein [Pedobacter sp. KR3-3]|uniref:FecR family protein n=1 Tax=Pedobacter albus TaxID=3113905 RepID=A0ABU7IBH2_9SPHI|nr:FecR family protein [Pedobacter sp. KR3-3]MEE1946631.1 FecR family protein [Pedobacter sp. KR3-3]
MLGIRMEKPNPQLQELAYKWKNGTLTPEEKIRFEQWYNSFNDEELLLSESKYVDEQQLKAHLKANIDQQLAQEVAQPKTFKLWPRIAAVAAVVLVVFGATLFKEPIQNLFNPVQQMQLATLPGQHRQIQLADGTKVWLSPATQISYPNAFRGHERQIQVSGEAFFEVKHDPEHPFVIQSGAMRTIVLGTSFNVRAYPAANKAEVTVVSGKVGVTAQQKTEIMTANQRVVFNKRTKGLVKENYPEAQQFIEQRIGLFNYNGASLLTVSQALEMQYGISIQLAPSLLNKAFYGQLKTSIPLPQTLDKLAAVMDITWHKDGKTYLLQPKNPNNN